MICERHCRSARSPFRPDLQDSLREESLGLWEHYNDHSREPRRPRAMKLTGPALRLGETSCRSSRPGNLSGAFGGGDTGGKHGI